MRAALALLALLAAGPAVAEAPPKELLCHFEERLAGTLADGTLRPADGADQAAKRGDVTFSEITGETARMRIGNGKLGERQVRVLREPNAWTFLYFNPGFTLATATVQLRPSPSGYPASWMQHGWLAGDLTLAVRTGSCFRTSGAL